MKTIKARKYSGGYTLVELLIVVSILSILISIAMPRLDIILQRAHQSKARSVLGSIRSAIAIYYGENTYFPLAEYPEGNDHYTDGFSLTTILQPKYISNIPIPKLFDRRSTYNDLSVSYDDSAQTLMSQNPPNDVFILFGPPAYTSLLNSPYAYDNRQGNIYIPNGNYDTSGNFFYMW